MFFIPIGLGTWPKIFPVAIFLIAFTCIAWSLPYFKNAKTYDEYAVTAAKPLGDLRLKVIIQSCAGHLSVAACETLSKLDKTNKTETETTEQKKAKTEDLKTQGVLAIVSKTMKDTTESLEYIKNFGNDPELWTPEAKAAASYPEYLMAYEKYETGLRKIEKDRGFLTRKNVNFARLVRASFTHNGWAHLLGNLLFLIIFGLAVEQRIGWGLTAAIFLAGSFVGLSVQLFYSPGAILGASAGIMALMGAFFVFFRRFEMKFVFTFSFIYFRSFYFAVFWTLPLFYFIADFAVNPEDSSVAHMAHVGGLLFGSVAAFLLQRKAPADHPFMYDQEKNIYLQMKRAPTTAEMWALLEYGLSWNVQNRLFLEAFFEAAEMSGFKPSPSQTKKLLAWVKYHLRSANKKADVDNVSLFLAQVNGTLALEPLLQPLSWQNILTIADHSTRNRRWALSLTLYRHCWSRVSNEETRTLLQTTCEKIEQTIHEENYLNGPALAVVGE